LGGEGNEIGIIDIDATGLHFIDAGKAAGRTTPIPPHLAALLKQLETQERG
jgi:hypothetical protein